MLKKVLVMVASKYSGIKAKMREIETRLIIHSLLLQEKKMVSQCFNVQNMVEDEDGGSENTNSNSFAATPNSIMLLPEEEEEEEEDDDNKSYWDHSVSSIEMVKNAIEAQGKEFRLEEDIDQVADLFIQRFHHQNRFHHHSFPTSPH
ncbi:hypothetical protein ABFX02_06G000100 [Erythranthe guttata]